MAAERGQVYQTLRRLERDGLVEADGDAEESRQKLFRITDAGAAEVADWLRRPPDPSSPPRDHLVIKILVSIRLSGVDVRDVIQAPRRYLGEQTQQWTRVQADASPDDVSLVLVVDAELLRLDSVIRWLNGADGRLRRTDLEAGGATLSELSRSAQAQLRRRVIGHVFQDFNLLAGLTASENVTTPLELDGMSPKQARVFGAEELEALGRGDRAEHFPDELSRGNGSAWRLPAQWSASVRCCSRTNRPAPSTARTARR